eukprot:TRINITY_DN13754_c0_g1_i1.p1 TRINITY_DN13754_c0_g1~~TRINITY_DN13754_c0_g1_i1.p1  ORF type:complete len:234 (+),score=33.31 TRINITY_DN13754_c0_g1_i1:40-741(+)
MNTERRKDRILHNITPNLSPKGYFTRFLRDKKDEPLQLTKKEPFKKRQASPKVTKEIDATPFFKETCENTFKDTFTKAQEAQTHKRSASFTRVSPRNTYTHERKYSHVPPRTEENTISNRCKVTPRRKQTLTPTHRELRQMIEHRGNIQTNISKLRSKIEKNRTVKCNKENQMDTSNRGLATQRDLSFKLSPGSPYMTSQDSLISKTKIFSMKIDGKIFDTLHSIHTLSLIHI